MWTCADSSGAFLPLLRPSAGLWPPITARPSTFKLINLTSNYGLIRLRRFVRSDKKYRDSFRDATIRQKADRRSLCPRRLRHLHSE